MLCCFARLHLRPFHSWGVWGKLVTRGIRENEWIKCLFGQKRREWGQGQHKSPEWQAGYFKVWCQHGLPQAESTLESVWKPCSSHPWYSTLFLVQLDSVPLILSYILSCIFLLPSFLLLFDAFGRQICPLGIFFKMLKR